MRSTQTEEENAAIDLSPMIDVVFLLLIFFVLTTVFVVETGVEVNLAEAGSARPVDHNAIRFAVTESGEIFYGGSPVPSASVRPLITRLTRDARRPVVIEADTLAPSGILVALVDEATRSGATSVHLAATEPRP